MDSRIKGLWLKALRSGEYTQGQCYLKQSHEGDDSYCCLGVLTNLYIQETGDGRWKDIGDSMGTTKFSYESNEGHEEVTYLPKEVMEWANINHMNPTIVPLERSLAVMNDGGDSFENIALAIEEYL